jgi:hypothetical protein
MSTLAGDQPQVHFQNHILVGLGGTGGSTLREFRKELFQRHRDNLPQGLRLEYVYLDSSDHDLNESESWRVLGSSVQLPNDSRIQISVPNLRTMVDNAPQFPAISQWLGDVSVWRTYLDNQQGLRAAGGQRRRMGRVLCAANIAAFNRQIARHYNTVTTGGHSGTAGNEGVTFHILCGLAGGTGSGSVVDVVIQIGKFIKERSADKTDRILVYALLPEENPVGGRAERYYFSNGYAALLELNALSVGSFLPHDVADSRGRRTEPDRFACFNGCYIFTNKTESGTVYDVRDMPALLSTFLYQKIVAIGDAGSWSALVQQENSENGNSAPEPRGVEGADSGMPAPAPERSVRFLSFGVKRVAVPEQEIREYLAYNFARQAILQLRFNNWTDSFGFIENPRNTDHSGYRSAAMLEAFRMSEDHLILSKPILESDQAMRWKPIEEFWQVYLSNIFEDVVGGANKNFIVQELVAKGTEWFDTGYRNVGVSTFYKRKEATLNQEAREIVRFIEDHLFAQWLQGQVAMIEISGSKDTEHPVRGILQTLREELEERKTKCLGNVPVCGTRVRELQEDLDSVESEYAKIGPVDIFSKRQRLQTEGARVLEESLIVRTRALGYAYAAKLCDAILRDLEDFTGQVTACSAILQNALTSFDKGIKQRCQDQGQPDFGKGFVRFYDAENVRRVTKRLVLDRDAQAAQAGAVRKAIREQMTSQRPTFHDLEEQLNLHRLTQVLELQSFDQSAKAHDALGLKAEERLFGLGILDQVLAKYPTRQARKQFAESVIPQASTLARIDLTQASNTEANPKPDEILRRSLSVIGSGLTAPTGATLPPPVAELKAELQSAPKTQLQRFEFVEAAGQTSDLCFVSLTNLMPLRTVEHVAFLRRKYGEIVGKGAAPEDKLFLHIEGQGGEYPGLFAATMEEIRARARGVLLLACALELLVEQTDARTGRHALTYTEVDEYGVPVEVIPYGDNLIHSCATMTAPKLRRLEGAVEGRIRADDFLHQDKKKELFGLVARKLQDLLPLCGNSAQHPDYTAFTEAYRQIRTRLQAA